MSAAALSWKVWMDDHDFHTVFRVREAAGRGDFERARRWRGRDKTPVRAMKERQKNSLDSSSSKSGIMRDPTWAADRYINME